MTHVQIHPTATGHQLLLDGIDVSRFVTADGVNIEPGAGPIPWKVTLTLNTNDIDIDMPDALVVTKPLDVPAAGDFTLLLQGDFGFDRAKAISKALQDSYGPRCSVIVVDLENASLSVLTDQQLTSLGLQRIPS